MMIGKQNCCLNQCKYEPCKKTQLLPCYKILHIHHLPSIIKIMGAWKRPPTVIGMPSNLSIPYFDKNVKCSLLFSGKSKLQTQKRGQPSTGLSSLLYHTYFMPLVRQGGFMQCFLSPACPGGSSRTCPDTAMQNCPTRNPVPCRGGECRSNPRGGRSRSSSHS